MAAGTLPRRLPAPPGVTGLPGVALLRESRTRPVEMLRELQQRFGDTYRWGVGGPLLQLAALHPDGAERVLAQNHKNYRKGIINAQFRVLDGEGLVTSEGEHWIRQRRMAGPAFHRPRLAAIGGVMADAAESTVERWRGAAREGRVVEVEPEMMRLALRVAGGALFGMDVGDEAGEIRRAVDVARDYLTFRFYLPFYPTWLPTAANRRFFAAKKVLDDVVYGIIAERRRSGEDRGDLLSMFMLARDEESGEGMSDLQLRDEVMTMLMAGHESTAVTMSWLLYLVARHPQVQERLRAEAETALGGRTPAAEDLAALPYHRMVVEETLRLYPPAWGLSRQAIEADEICGCAVPGGSYVLLCQYLTHRHPEFWDDPELFDPERFAPERAQGRHRFAYFPFGGGPRGCIGSGFALMEAQIVLAALVQHFRIEPADDRPLELEPLLSLRVKGGVRVKLEERRS
jgi:cytochrome P450